MTSKPVVNIDNINHYLGHEILSMDRISAVFRQGRRKRIVSARVKVTLLYDHTSEGCGCGRAFEVEIIHARTGRVLRSTTVHC